MNELVNQKFSDDFDLGRFSVRVQLNLVSSLVGNDHQKDSVDVSILTLDVSEDVDESLSFSELFTDGISGEFELVEVGSADGSVDFIDDKLDLLRNVLHVLGDISVTDFGDSSFEEIGYNFGS